MRCIHCNKELNFEEMYYYENSCEECEIYFHSTRHEKRKIKLVRLRVKLYLRRLMNRYRSK